MQRQFPLCIYCFPFKIRISFTSGKVNKVWRESEYEIKEHGSCRENI